MFHQEIKGAVNFEKINLYVIPLCWIVVLRYTPSHVLYLKSYVDVAMVTPQT